MNRLFFDIETSPNIVTTWRAGRDQWISPDNILSERGIICICYKWEGSKLVHSLEWDKNQDDRSMVKKFLEIAEGADELVAHNGDRYDIRFLAGRALFHNLDPYPEIKTIDTYKIAKRHFDLNSFKLDYIAQYLGLGEKVKTEYDMWIDILINKDPSAMAKMVEYCKHDVALLEKVYHRLAKYAKPKTHAGVLAGLEKWTCPHCTSTEVIKSKTTTTAAGYIKHQMQCKGCGRYFSISDSAFKRYNER